MIKTQVTERTHCPTCKSSLVWLFNTETHPKFKYCVNCMNTHTAEISMERAEERKEYKSTNNPRVPICKFKKERAKILLPEY